MSRRIPRRLFRVRRRSAPNYLPAVIELGCRVRPGEVAQIHVLHDDGCPALAGRICDCRPIVRLVERTA